MKSKGSVSLFLLMVVLVLLATPIACTSMPIASTSTPIASTSTPIASTSEDVTLPAHPEVTRITCEESCQLMGEVIQMTFVDCRPVDSFNKSHITGALNFPNLLLEELRMLRLNALSRNRLIVIYCDKPDGGDSARLALQLWELGFDRENVKILSGGWGRWVELGYPAAARVRWPQSYLTSDPDDEEDAF